MSLDGILFTEVTTSRKVSTLDLLSTLSFILIICNGLVITFYDEVYTHNEKIIFMITITNSTFTEIQMIY